MNAFAHYPIIIASQDAVVNYIFKENAGKIKKVAKFIKFRLDKSVSRAYNATRKDKGVLSKSLEAPIFLFWKELSVWLM